MLLKDEFVGRAPVGTRQSCKGSSSRSGSVDCAGPDGGDDGSWKNSSVAHVAGPDGHFRQAALNRTREYNLQNQRQLSFDLDHR